MDIDDEIFDFNLIVKLNNSEQQWHDDAVKCPYCGYVDDDWSDGSPQDSFEYDCGDCGKAYSIEVTHSWIAQSSQHFKCEGCKKESGEVRRHWPTQDIKDEPNYLCWSCFYKVQEGLVNV